MEHTVKAYIGQQPTQVLEVLLRQYSETEEKLMANMDTVLLILEELKRREGYSEEELAERAKQAWEQFLKYYAEWEDSE